MRRLLLVLSLATLLVLGGCASHEETNMLIAQANTDRYTAFTKGMNSATTEGARIAIAMSYASGMGMQEFFRPETARDYMVAGIPYISLAMGLFSGQIGDRSDSPTIEAGRDVFIESSKADNTSLYGSSTTDLLNSISYGTNGGTGSYSEPVAVE
jgi:hypothetical protein